MELPDDVIGEVARYLVGTSALACLAVNKQWRRVMRLKVQYFASRPRVEITKRSLRSLAHQLPNIVNLKLESTTQYPGTASELRHFKYLQKLNLQLCNETGQEDCHHIAKLTGLTHLNIKYINRMTNLGPLLALQKLRVLQVGNWLLKSSHVCLLVRYWTSLQELELESMYIEDNILGNLFVMPGLTQLAIINPQNKCLEQGHLPKVLSSLRGPMKLKSLKISRYRFPIKKLEPFIALARNLEMLELRHVSFDVTQFVEQYECVNAYFAQNGDRLGLRVVFDGREIFSGD